MHPIFLNKREVIFLMCLVVLFLFNLPPLIADTNTPASTTAPAVTTPPASTDPVPYQADEFPDWSLKLRRAEIIAFGTVPLTFLISFFAYDYIRWGIHLGDSSYNPFNPNRIAVTGNEAIGVALTACGISICVAIIDYWIGEMQAKNNKAKNLKEPMLNASN